MSASLPLISIVIPCKNEEAYIENCVKSIFLGNYPPEQLEVFVSDGKSTDNSLAILKKLSSKFKGLHVLVNAKETTPFALNLGIAKAKGNYIMILGAHAVLDENYFVEAINEINNNEEIDVIGGVLNNIDESSTSKVISKAMSSPVGVGSAHFRTGAASGFVDTVAFGLYKREVFEKIGLFDEELTRNQDDELNYRVSKAGFKMYLSKKLKLKYFVRGTFKKLANQFYQYGYWKVLVNKKHKAITTVRQLFPMFFVLFLCFGWLVSIIYTPLFALYLFVVALYVVMCLFASIKLANSFKEVFGVLRSIVTMHLNYGAGYIKGIFDFVILNRKPNAKSKQLTR